MTNAQFRSGFINIIGNPNVGKSTLMNALMNDKLSIITSKPQTTRHRILGILSDEECQMIFSDSPGLIDTPAYGLQKRMNSFAYASFEDADVLLFVTDIFEKYTGDEKVIKALKTSTVPKFLIVNKLDLDHDKKANEVLEWWATQLTFDQTFLISAINKEGIEALHQAIRLHLPFGPEYYPPDQISDKPERFFVSEIIREKILMQYKQEIPYSCEVVVESFKEGTSTGGDIINIATTIYVERNQQKAILIGKDGSAIKKLGIASRLDLEDFFNKKIFLELHVKVKENWRNSDQLLKSFGYEE